MMEGATGTSGGYDHNVSAYEGLLEAIVNGFVASDRLIERSKMSVIPCWRIAFPLTCLTGMWERSMATPAALVRS